MVTTKKKQVNLKGYDLCSKKRTHNDNGTRATKGVSYETK
jgi:hypothetical protein